MRNSKRMYALFFTAIMVLGISMPFMMSTPASGTTYQIYPSFSVYLLTPSANPTRQQWSLLITNNLKGMGIDAHQVIVPWSTMYARMLTPAANVTGKSYTQGGYDLGFIGWAMSPEPNAFPFFHSSQLAPLGSNYYLLNDSTNDALINTIVHDTNQTSRLAEVKQWQQWDYNYTPNVVISYEKEAVVFNKSYDAFAFQHYFYPVWPAVELWNNTARGTGFDNCTIAQTGPAPQIGLVPWLSTSYYDLTAFGPIYGPEGFGLFGYNGSFTSVADLNAATVPIMGYANYTVTNGGKNWTFWVKPGIHFQNGEVLDGRDFVYSMRYVMTPGSGSADSGVYGYLTSVICGQNIAAGIAAGYGNKSVYWAGEAGTPGASLPLNYDEVHVNIIAPWAWGLQDLGMTTILPADVLLNRSAGVVPYSQWNPSNAGVLQTTAYNTGVGSYWYYMKDGTPSTNTESRRTGPFGAGPYQWVDYNPTTFVVHETKFLNYFDRSRLEAAGLYQIVNYRVYNIPGISAAIAALDSGSVQILDSQYHLYNSFSSLDLSKCSYVSYDAFGVQEMGFNLQHPLFGTGTGTPLGISDPTQAAAAAWHMRRAVELLVPKDTIIKTMLNGYGSFGITTPVTKATAGFDTSIVPRNYTYSVAQQLAKTEFEAAGYSFVPPAPPTFWDSYGLLLAVVELAVIVVLGGFYFLRPRKMA